MQKDADVEKDKKICRENFSKLLENVSLIKYTIKLVDDSTYLTKTLEIADAFIDNITKICERKNIFLKDGKILSTYKFNITKLFYDTI